MVQHLVDADNPVNERMIFNCHSCQNELHEVDVQRSLLKIIETRILVIKS